VVASTSDSTSCGRRYIDYQRLYKDIYACNSGDCYARKVLQIDRVPLIVVFPQVPAARAEAISALRAEMAYGIDRMADHLKERARSGAPGLPNLSGVEDLQRRAKAKLDRIAQPLNESDDERLRRLGLTPEMVELAMLVRRS
jgi:hypothetical protein